MILNRYKHRIQDALRLTDPLSVQRTVENIKRDVLKGAAPFNYRPSEMIARLVLTGDISEQQVRMRCAQGSDLSVQQNTAASILLLEGARSLRNSPITCHELKTLRGYKIRDDLGFMVRVPFFYVKDGVVYVPWFQFCKSLQYTSYQWAVLALILQDLFGETFAPHKCEVVFIDLSAPPQADARSFKANFASQLPQMTKKEVEDFFKVYAEAYDICVEQGIEKAAPARKPKEQKPDDRQTGLFDLD